MFNNSFFEDLSGRLAAIIPLGEEVRDDLRTKIEQLLKSSFANLDLLSREEFDAQRQALGRAEKRIEELEQTLDELGKKFEQLQGQSTSE